MPRTFGTFTTCEPVYAKGVFRMSMTFKAKIKMDGEAIGHVSDYAADLFRRILIANGLHDYAWPPDEVGVLPTDEFRGAVLSFATRASKRKLVVIQ